MLAAFVAARGFARLECGDEPRGKRRALFAMYAFAVSQ
jgi:hypothetical protein